MKPHLAVLVGALLATSVSAQTAEAVGLYNTGTSGGIYTLVSGPVGFTGGLYEPVSGVYPLNGAWMANSTTAQWLAIYSGTAAPAANLPVASVAGGTYNVRLTFDLGAISYRDLSFDIGAAVDNSLAVQLNGVALSNSGSPVADGDRNYDSLSHYTYHVTGANLQGGFNTLNFAVTNISGPAGLYVQYSNFTVIPEPSTYALWLGVTTLAIAFVRRFRR